MKRSSTRTVVLSKAMRYVDEDTRREFKDRRIQSLECDNYVENDANADNEEEYGYSEDEKPALKRKRGKAAAKKGVGQRNKWASRPVKSLERVLLENGIIPQEEIKQSVASSRKKEQSNNDLAEIDEDEDERSTMMEQIDQKSSMTADQTGTAAVNYYTAAAKPSMLPPRRSFCSVCGYIGNYTCTRCGSRFCSVKCNENHKETRCMKFSL